MQTAEEQLSHNTIATPGLMSLPASVKLATNDVTSTMSVSPSRTHMRRIDGDASGVMVGTRAPGSQTAAAGYVRFYSPITGRLTGPLLDAAGIGLRTRVLDVATGPGCLAARAAARGASVMGVDIDESMVQLARRRHPELDFRQADAAALPFEDGSFDAVVANFLVHHLRSAPDAIAEFARVLVPGGVVALTAWDVPARTRFAGVFLEAIAGCGVSAPERSTPRRDFFHYSTDAAFAGLLTAGGLQDVVVRTTAFQHSVATTGELWDGLLAGIDRSSAMLILQQSKQVQRQIRRAFERRAGVYWTGERLDLPVSAKVASGRRPAA
jgi:SAM-dependent methyltransferase